MKKSNESSFGQAVIESLTEFIHAAERGEPITARTVKMEISNRKYAAREVKSIRRTMNVSQSVFARLLGVSTKLVQAWESGANQPSELACNLFDEIEADPPAWLARKLARQSKQAKSRRRRAHLV